MRCFYISAHVCDLYFLFGSFRLALKPPVQVKKFPNEFADCVSAYMLPAADHTVQAYYRVMLLRGCAHMNPQHPPRLIQGLAVAATFPESASIILGPNQTIQ